MLFIGVLCLIVLLSSLLLTNGSYKSRVESGVITEATGLSRETKQVGTFESITDSVNIAVSSQGFVIALFPIYSSMSYAARPKVLYSVTFALLFTLSTYSLLSFISIAYFGEANIQQSIFVNIQQEEGIASVLLRCLFLMIFFCNIPFVFFAGKVALLAVVYECFYEKKATTVFEVGNTV